MSMFIVQNEREDGTYVIDLNGMPYHVIESDPLFAEVKQQAEGMVLEPDAPMEPPLAAAAPATASKLGLKRACDEMGIWDQVKAAIAANPDAQEEWDLAIDIKRTDPLTQKLIEKLQFSAEQVDDIIIRANALV